MRRWSRSILLLLITCAAIGILENVHMRRLT